MSSVVASSTSMLRPRCPSACLCRLSSSFSGGARGASLASMAPGAQEVHSRTDCVVSEVNPDLQTALLWPLRGGGNNIWHVPGGLKAARAKQRSRTDLPVYTFSLRTFNAEEELGEAVGEAACIRFKRWLPHSSFRQVRRRTA